MHLKAWRRLWDWSRSPETPKKNKNIRFSLLGWLPKSSKSQNGFADHPSPIFKRPPTLFAIFGRASGQIFKKTVKNKRKTPFWGSLKRDRRSPVVSSKQGHGPMQGLVQA